MGAMHSDREPQTGWSSTSPEHDSKPDPRRLGQGRRATRNVIAKVRVAARSDAILRARQAGAGQCE